MSEPATEATQAAAHGARKTGAAFGKKMGPFPLWAWGLIAGGVILAYHVLNNRTPATPAATDTTSTDPGLDGTATATGAGPYGVSGFFVPLDAFGKAPTTPAPTTPAPPRPVTPSRGIPHGFIPHWHPPTPPDQIRARAIPPHIVHVPETDTNEHELARQFFGSQTYWQLIHNANRGNLPTSGHIPAGTRVFIPQN